MDSSFDALPPLDAACRIIVTIPARDEASLIERSLAAFAQQRAVDGTPLPDKVFEIVVFANDCRDDTAARARRAAARYRHVPIHVVEGCLPSSCANVGMARKLVMDAASARFFDGAMKSGIVASADADTIVDAKWIAYLAEESRAVDAVAGHVTIGEAERASMHAPVRLLYVRELAFRRLLAEVEAELDPVLEDPSPRHASFVGASFGVRADIYVAAGGIVPRATLEDLAFSKALRRIDARIRHSTRMCATTSARVRARVVGGFGSFMADLVERGRRRDTFYVEAAEFWIDDFRARAALRRVWLGSERTPDEAFISSTLGLQFAEWRALVDPDRPFGLVHARIQARAAATRPRYEPVPVEVAIAALREAATSRNVVVPTRTSAASGAG